MRSSFISAIVAGSLLISATAAGARQPGAIPARGSTEVGDSDELGGGLLAIIGLIVVLLIIGGVVLLDGDDDDLPTSP